MSISESLVERMRGWRHALHAVPETAFEELATAAMVAGVLREAGIETHEGVGRTGVVGVLRRGAGPSIGLRADLDALPLQEKNTFAHASRQAGKMHACGHDGHTAMLLGAALALQDDPGWCGTVHLIFQPAEEVAGGGQVMVDDGLFERFPCDRVFGLHNWPALPFGQFVANAGAMMASFDTFEIVVQGRGAHAAMPEQGIDTLLCTSEIVLALQSIVSRRLSAHETAVVSVTQIHGGDAYNVLPDDAVIRGTVRCFSLDTQQRIETLIGEIATGIARTHGAQATLAYRYGYPATINVPLEAERARTAAARVSGVTGVVESRASMASEDFAFMLQRRPGAYVWLGTGGAVPLHNPYYDFNDAALALGAGFWVELVRTCAQTN